MEALVTLAASSIIAWAVNFDPIKGAILLLIIFSML